MSQTKLSVLILKPTENFLGWIASQFPDVELPRLAAIQQDNTAYSIPRYIDNESFLETIETFYPLMLRHESSRLLGQVLSSHLTGSFFDFLCCFRFELHTEVMMMESNLGKRDSLLCIKPRTIELSCASSDTKHSKAEEATEDSLQLSHFMDNTTALVKNFRDVSEVAPFIKHHYRPIFRQEMQRLSEDAQYYPVVNSFKIFTRYFNVEYHSQVVHLH